MSVEDYQQAVLDSQQQILTSIQDLNTNIASLLSLQGEYYAVSVLAYACIFAVLVVLLIMVSLKVGR